MAHFFHPWFASMKPYRIFGHTADIGIDVRGKTPEDVFINSAKAMFEIIADTSCIKSRKKVEIVKEARSYDELLREWLSELHYLYSVKRIVFGEFVIRELNDKIIKAVAFGQKLSYNKVKTEIKAVTYHGLEFKKTKDGFRARVIFDV